MTLHAGFPRPIQTVRGPIPFDLLGVTDAHNHLWIEPPAGAEPGCPVLNRQDIILAELIDYRKSGGSAILDCQPGGCGRDGNRLRALSSASGVEIVACTGFHRRKYYSPDYWLWASTAEEAALAFREELQTGLAETRADLFPIRAGFIKLALEASLGETPQAVLQGAAQAAAETGAAIEVHTEKGAMAREAFAFFQKAGVPAGQLVFCHMDKRADFSLHADLARAGVLLEYDTFFRPQYEPEKNLWSLLDKMAAEILCSQIALATDMADASLYRSLGKGPGLASLPTLIRARLEERGFSNEAIRQMLGENIARRLAGLT
ncbi:MAG TPA: hypothetical protein VMT46_02360 [Anaerolineaceae bacterium]|nr:hypothetical protein [Anaerolineaceae bacterium]